jgi:hypothetical protein
MIVNMYVDHLMSTAPASPEDVWNATREHSKLFSDAAARVGMSPKEYAEFRKALLNGKATYVTLPTKVDAMSGQRHGYVYAVRNAVMTTPQLGWKVTLSDGNMVFVPQVCANISFLHGKPPKVVAMHRKPHFVQADVTEPVTQVSMVPPSEVLPPVVDAPATAQQAVAAGGGGFPFFGWIPAAIGGIVAGVHSTTTPPPSCTHGSSEAGACSK